jgi:hypothetical protein
MAEWGTSTNSATGHDQAFIVDISEAGNMSMLSNPAGSPNQPNEPVMADEAAPATAQEDQVRTIAARACLSCRRLKVCRLLWKIESGHVRC